MITVLLQTETHFPINRRGVRAAIEDRLRHAVHGDTEVSVSVIGDRRMRQLNREYRHINETTDVLSFPFNDPSSGTKPFIDAPDGVLRLGDIVVSYPRVVEAATIENRMVDEVIVELVLHGLEHLLGIHHDE